MGIANLLDSLRAALATIRDANACWRRRASGLRSIRREGRKILSKRVIRGLAVTGESKLAAPKSMNFWGSSKTAYPKRSARISAAKRNSTFLEQSGVLANSLRAIDRVCRVPFFDTFSR